MNFLDKRVLIIGASSGIGLSLASKLTLEGAKVIGTYNTNIIPLVYIDACKCDLTKEDEITELFGYIKKEYQNIDYVINCAALSMDKDITEKTKAEFMKVLEVNLVGTFLVCKKALSIMKNGVIINISSTNASTTYNPISMDYDASKAGIENLTKNLALRYPDIKICALAPNWIATDSVLEMSPIYLESELKRINQKKLLTKEEVVNKIIDILQNKEIKSGEIIRMDDSNEK
ncbi:MAG: SDR family oxidoreductase [Bacilli bacterium]|nr:SDR family oxidoreductase [Bacilli bacterium]